MILYKRKDTILQPNLRGLGKDTRIGAFGSHCNKTELNVFRVEEFLVLRDR